MLMQFILQYCTSFMYVYISRLKEKFDETVLLLPTFGVLMTKSFEEKHAASENTHINFMTSSLSDMW